MSDINDTNQGFFLKIESIRKRSHASSLLLKQDDIIIAVNNEIFTLRTIDYFFHNELSVRIM